jgi:hypothetical protein
MADVILGGSVKWFSTVQNYELIAVLAVLLGLSITTFFPYWLKLKNNPSIKFDYEYVKNALLAGVVIFLASTDAEPQTTAIRYAILVFKDTLIGNVALNQINKGRRKDDIVISEVHP